MASHTVREMLDRSRRFHHEMAAYYQKLDNEADQERVHMILRYLQRHEQNLETCLAAYTEEATAAVLGTWFRFTSGFEIPDCSEFMNVDPKLPVDEVVSLAMRYDQCLINLYRMAAQNASSDKVRDLFGNLLTMAEAEEHRLARDTVGMQDL